MGDEQQVWCVSWTAALVPIVSIIPTESVFSHTSSDTLIIPATHLFGLPLFSAQTAWDEVLSGVQERKEGEEHNDQQEQDAHEAAVVPCEIEGFLAFI